MNLIQIQDRLKDLPTQAIMGYANGENPQVPPYLALGELNRRKQMEQKAAKAPQGTVKENIEQQVGLMSLQKLRQGQMAQQSAMQGAQAPTIPENTPEPTEQPQEEMAMAAGGITRLPAGDMDFASGGIIAFAGGNAVVDEFSAANPEFYSQQVEQDRLKNEEIQRIKNQKELIEKIKFLETAAPELAERLKRERASELPNAAPVAPAKVIEKPVDKSTQGVASLNKNAPAVVSNVAPSAPPAPAPVSAAMQLLNSEMGASTRPTPMTEFAPPKQTPIGEDYLKYMSEREGKNKQDDERFKEREASRSKRDFFQALIDSGEASRGQKGIGAVFGGFGKSYGKSATDADDRQVAYEKVQQERQDNNAKLKFEIANLRRAEERGDAKSVYDSKAKIFEYQQKDRELAVQAAGQTARIESAERISKDEIGSRERISALDRQARASVQAMPSAEQRQAEKVIASFLEKNPKMSYFDGFQAYSNAKTGSGERLDLAGLKLLQKDASEAVNSLTASKEQKAQAAATLKDVNAKIAQMAGLGSIGSGASSGKVVDFNSLPK